VIRSRLAQNALDEAAKNIVGPSAPVRQGLHVAGSNLRLDPKAFRFAKQINTEAEAIRTLLDQALETNGFAAADQPKPRGKRRP
jgi:hypothetical protein